MISADKPGPPTGSGWVDDLLVAAGRGDAQAFGLFYDHVAAMVVGCVREAVGDLVRAEEATREIFVEVWRTAGSYSPEQGAAASWVMALARRWTTERLRPSPAPESVSGSGGDHGRIADGLARLTQPQREVLLRIQRQGQTYGDIGKAMNLPVSAVSALARDAVTLLHEVLGGS